MAVLLGRTTAGTTADFLTGGDSGAWRFLAAASGNVATLWFQSKVSNASPATTSVEIGIYTDSATKPNTKLGSATNSVAAQVQGTAAFSVTLGTPVAVVSGTAYWLAIAPGPASVGFDFQGDASAGTGGWSIDTPASPLPATWTENVNNAGPGAIIWGEDAAVAAVRPRAARRVRPRQVAVGGARYGAG